MYHAVRGTWGHGTALAWKDKRKEMVTSFFRGHMMSVIMSVATPTVIPRPKIFPHLLPRPPQPHPTPLPKPGRVYGRINARRDLVKEMEDLSDEESELEELVS